MYANLFTFVSASVCDCWGTWPSVCFFMVYFMYNPNLMFVLNIIPQKIARSGKMSANQISYTIWQFFIQSSNLKSAATIEPSTYPFEGFVRVTSSNFFLPGFPADRFLAQKLALLFLRRKNRGVGSQVRKKV